MTTYDGRAAYHVRRFPRPSPSVFAYWKRSKAGGAEGLGTRLTHPPLNVACRGRFWILMRLIDPRIYDFHRPHPGPQDNMQIGGVRCAISQIWPKFREMLGENPADIQL